jgi:hypothetical protein
LDYVSNVNHTAGVSWGNGWLTQRYKLAPTISYFEIIQVNSERAVFSLEASQNVIGLDQQDFVLTGSGCELTEFNSSGTLASGAITGCQSGQISLTLNQQSFGSAELGPPSAVTATLLFDASGPEFSFVSESFLTSASEQVIDFEVSDNLQLDESVFTLDGCSAMEIIGSQAMLAGCSEGEVTLTLLADSLSDNWQNLGPSEPVLMTFVVDQTAPTASWSAIVVTGSGPFSYSASLWFSEPVSISNLVTAFAATTECQTDLEEFSQELRFSASCGHASLEWSAAGIAQDSAGNQLVMSELSVQLANPAPVVAAAPQPVPAPVATEPAPSQEIDLVIEEPEVLAPDETVQPETKSDLVTVIWSPAERARTVADPASNQSNPVTLEAQSAPVSEQPVTESGAVELDVEPTPQPRISEDEVPVQPVLGQELPLDQPGFPWWPVALLVGLGALGVGAWRLTGR